MSQGIRISVERDELKAEMKLSVARRLIISLVLAISRFLRISNFSLSLFAHCSDK